MVNHQEQQTVSLGIATQAGQTAVGFHVNAFSPREICLGSDLNPEKTLLTAGKLQGRCSECMSTFVFDVYLMEWIKQIIEEFEP